MKWGELKMVYFKTKFGKAKSEGAIYDMDKNNYSRPFHNLKITIGKNKGKRFGLFEDEIF